MSFKSAVITFPGSNCDRDALLAIVKQKGPACHTNRKSCFFTGILDGSEFELMVPVDQNG